MRFIKDFLYIIIIFLVVNITACNNTSEKMESSDSKELIALFDNDLKTFRLEFNGIDISKLDLITSICCGDRLKEYDFPNISSLSFGEYDNGDIGCIRNLDVKLGEWIEYEMFVNEGENVKYSFWGLTYKNENEERYFQLLNDGLDDDAYSFMPFIATDTMSFGYTELGVESSLYCACISRAEQLDIDGKYEWICHGTYPGSLYRIPTKAFPCMIAANCITVDDALAFIGAVDEDYNIIYPSVVPSLDVFTFNVDVSGYSNHSFESFALMDSSGRHGILEFINNRPIWHEGIDCSFNYFVQKECLLEDDGTYNEQLGKGIGRYNAISPFLDNLKNTNEHLNLMNSIDYSYMNFYDEESRNIGTDKGGKAIDWRSEYVGYDVFLTYDYLKELGFDTSNVDQKYPLYAHYLDINTEQIILIDSYDTWKNNKDHLKCVYDMNYCLDEKNFDEITNIIRWNGLFNKNNSKKLDDYNLVFNKVHTIIADPMNCRLTRYFSDAITSSYTVSYSDFEH